MDDSTRYRDCTKFLRNLSDKGKGYIEFRESIVILQEEAVIKGLDDGMMKMIMSIIKKSHLSSTSYVSLIKCMIPIGKVDDSEAEKLIAWFFSRSVAVTALNTLLQWFIGCWEYQLINRFTLYKFYDVFFFTMLKNEKLESRLAQLIYLTTKPEDVTRRQVERLMKVNERYRKPPKHITALLSLFKSYKPEFVPEKIPAINIQSVWRPILEIIQTGFKDALERINQTQNNEENFNWNFANVPKTKKNQEPLVPSVGYFNIGSNIFKNKTEKSIFDVSSFAELGEYQNSIKLPCKATSLLTNTIGYHLLTFTDIEYQQRFIYNLYNSLWKSFIFENGRYSFEEMDKILDMTKEFCRYMQHGIPIVSYFINEYLSCSMDEHHLKLLELMQWSSVSVPELQDYVLKHMKLMFYTSSVNVKCKIIRTLRMLLVNLFVINDDSFKDKTFPFLDQSFTGDLTEKVQIIEQFTRELIKSAVNIHFNNPLIMSEALSFYEQINILEVHKKTSYMPLTPPAVIYGCLVSKSCALLTRMCALLLQYRKIFKEHKERVPMRSAKNLIVYAEDLASALWYDNCFSNRFSDNRYFLNRLPENIVKESNEICNINSLLNIYQHCAVLPYLHTLSASGLQIKTKNDANDVAGCYYSHINQFIKAFLRKETTLSLSAVNYPGG